MILEKLNGSEDIKALDGPQVDALCRELRTLLVSSVAKTGGHLASNLGVVELMVAIHRVFDTAQDRLVFDVGHQCYVHKILTGRRERFDTLRQFGGISGFPKPCESVHDAFVAGHASNSISVALGMARARTLQHRDYSVIALIGDGALSGGLSFEGLNNAGASREPLIVILNDNGMSIAPNVGALSRHLQQLRTSPNYYELKRKYRQFMAGSQAGRALYGVSHDVKQALKKSILPSSTLFEEMGFTYMGPLNGHDVGLMTQALQQAKRLQRPVILHVQTVKGKGCPYAENDPGRFHGVGPFDPATGKALKEENSFSTVFGQELTAMAGEDERVCAITAAMPDGTGLTPFADRYPTRFFDVGIAEGHAVSMAGGMAKQGLLPVMAVYSTFLQRSYDMLLQDVALDGLHVVLGVDRAGLAGADGETHHGCYDALYLTHVPGMTVLCPASYAELREMLRRAVFDITGPVAVRYPKGEEGAYTGCCGNEPITLLRQGTDAVIVTYGPLVNNALEAAELLHQRHIETCVLKLNAIAPLDTEAVCTALADGRPLLMVEDCMENGCVGQRVAAILTQRRIPPRSLLLKNLGDRPAPQGKVSDLHRACGLDAASLADALEEAVRGE